jgi:hypothetical protein
MTVETASFISQLDATLPASGDPKSEGDNHLRLVKSVLKAQFPNFGTNAVTPTATEVNYLVGVTSAIQTQINALATAKSDKSGSTYTGTHDFSGATLQALTPTAGDATTKVATTAFVASTAFAGVLPGQTGNAGRFVTTSGTAASWGSVAGVTTLISTNTAAQNGYLYVLTASLTLTLPASPSAGDWVAVVNRSNTATPVIARNAQNIMGLAEDMTLNNTLARINLVFADATHGWVLT